MRPEDLGWKVVRVGNAFIPASQEIRTIRAGMTRTAAHRMAGELNRAVQADGYWPYVCYLVARESARRELERGARS